MNAATYLRQLKAGDVPGSDKVLIAAGGAGLGSGAVGHALNSDESSPIASGLTGAGLAALAALGLGKIPAVQKYFSKSFDASDKGKEIGTALSKSGWDYKNALSDMQFNQESRKRAAETIAANRGPKPTMDFSDRTLLEMAKYKMQMDRLQRVPNSPYTKEAYDNLSAFLFGAQQPAEVAQAAAKMRDNLVRSNRALNIRASRDELRNSLPQKAKQLEDKKSAARENIQKLSKDRADYIDFSKLAAGGALTAAGGLGGAAIGYENPLG